MTPQTRFAATAIVSIAAAVLLSPRVVGAARNPAVDDQMPPRPIPPYYWYDRTGSARLEVKPRTTQVFIDGYFVGIADEFDGYLQRLHVPAGQHVLELYLEGHRTKTAKVLIPPGGTLRFSHTMEPLALGETQEPRPTPDETAAHTPRRPGEPPLAARGRFGTLALRVQPADATILVDGEVWEAVDASGRLTVDLPEGPHLVEVRKEGFKPYSRTIEVRRGRTATVNVVLSSTSGVKS